MCSFYGILVLSSLGPGLCYVDSFEDSKAGSDLEIRQRFVPAIEALSSASCPYLPLISLDCTTGAVSLFAAC